MAEYSSHVLVCTNSENAEDRRHCGDKGGAAVRQSDRQQRGLYEPAQDMR